MRYIKLAVLALLSFTLSSNLLLAQNASTSLRGQVTDPTGAAIPNAQIHIVNKGTNAAADATSNGAGEYSFQQLTPGRYTITVTAKGFGQEILSAELLVAQPATVNPKLKITADTTIVDVSSTAQTINTTDASLGNSFSQSMIQALPSDNRQIGTFLSLQPGVLYLGDNPNFTQSTESRNGVVAGARSDQTNITLDGIDNNNQINPSGFLGALEPPIDSVDADTGRSSGGQANLITKSGTNELHGSLYEYNRNNWGQAAEWFTKEAQPLHRNIYGASLGGPLWKDKLFLFGNYEGLRKNEGYSVQRTVPGPVMRAGEVAYTDIGGNTNTLTSSQIASLDDPSCAVAAPAGTGTCIYNGTYAGAHIGVDPYALAFLNSYPMPAGPNEAQDPLNDASLTFTSPNPVKQNTYVSRLDFNISDKQHLFVRGLMQSYTTNDLEFLPGQGPQDIATDDSKGIAVGYTWSPTSNLVNTFLYGFTRQSTGQIGLGNFDFTYIRGIDYPFAYTGTNSTKVPLHNFTDDLSWTKGHHTIQVGANWRHFDYINTNNSNSYSSALTNASYLPGAAIAGTGNYLDPANAPVSDPVDVPDDGQNYDYAVLGLVGVISQVNNDYNYLVAPGGKTASLLPHGAPIHRDYRENEVEWYIQDQWKVKPNLTVTLGVRHSILQTPWEVNGQQVQPNIDMHQWFLTRGQQAALGNSVQPNFSFSASGKANNGKPFYPMNWLNFAPRFAVAYSPAPPEKSWLHKLTGGAGKTSIRAGFGLYYDHFGEGVVSNFANYGSFSLSTTLTNGAGTLDIGTLNGATPGPRFTDVHNVPTTVNPVQGPITYPYAAPTDGFQITYGIDDHIKTPYNEVVDLSLQREIKGGFTFEAAYVGRFGRHLLQASDLAQPLDLVDPASGSDYYSAITRLDQLYDEGYTDPTTIAPIPYFEDLFPDAAGVDAAGDGTAGYNATQNIYNIVFLNQSTRGNETNFLFDTDVFCDPGCGGQTYRYWNNQYASLYAFASVGSASYNAGQFTLRHPMSHGVDFDINYTYSRSIDLGSDTESNYYGGVGGKTTFYGQLQDSFNPWKSRAVSDFNTTHLITADWVLNLPVGRGREFGDNMSRLLDAVVGGWQLDGLARISSGLPIYGVLDSAGWATNWDIQGYTVQTGPIKMRRHQDANGAFEAFDDPAAAKANLRLPYGGEAGERNKFIGDGYFSIDSGLHKRFEVVGRSYFSLAFEVYNITNSVRFDPHENNAGTGYSASTFGEYIPSTLTQSRRFQFSGRFDF
jgi:hypothetical protein